MAFKLKGRMVATDASLYQGFDDALVTPPPDNQIQHPRYHFSCPVCYTFPRQPVQIHCTHLLCWDCCAKIMETTHNGHVHLCPVCREPFTDFKHIEFADLPVRLQYHMYRVRCPYNCGTEKNPEMMDIHQRRECRKRPVKCTVQGCTTVIPFKDMRAHLRAHENQATQRERDRARQQEVQHFFGTRPTRINPNEEDEPEEEHEEPFDDRSDRAFPPTQVHPDEPGFEEFRARYLPQ